MDDYVPDIKYWPQIQKDEVRYTAKVRRLRNYRKISLYFLISSFLLFALGLQVQSPWEWFSNAVALSGLVAVVSMAFFVYFAKEAKDWNSILEGKQRYIGAIKNKLDQEREEDQRRVAACEAILENHRPELEEMNYDTDLLTGLVAGGITASAFEEKTKRVLKYAKAIVLGEREQESGWARENRPQIEEDSTIEQPQAARDRHTYIIGKSGSGKTTLLRNMIYQDLRLGNGLGVIAPEQEMLTEEILPFIPESRLDDVIYFNPADSNPIPFNPLNLNEGEDLDLKADETLTIFKRLVGGEAGHRMETILRQAIYSLLAIPDTTLLDIPKLLDRANPHFRQQVISQLPDEYTREFWRDTYPQYPKDAHLPIINRLGRFTQPKVIRNTLCQAGKSLNFRELMDTGKVILFNLSDGILGEQNSQLLGQLIVSQFQMATASRANIPQDKRRRFYLYIDEFQTFTGSSTTSYEKILSRARKYRLALILAHQQTGQIPLELLKDIFGNVSTMVCFTVSYNDASRLSKEFIVNSAPLLPQEFIGLKVGETYCKMGTESFRMQTFQVTQKPNPQMLDQVIKRSRNWQPAQQQTSPQPPSKKESGEPVKPTEDDIFSGNPKSVF